MKNLNYLVFLLFLFATNLLFISCGDKEGHKDSPSALTPVIDNILPESGTRGDILTITGSGFGTDASKVKVLFNATNATNIISVTDTQIKVEVPGGLSDKAVNVTVYVSNSASNRKPFSYVTSIFINSISPESGKPGDIIIIEGGGFGTNASKVRVQFNTTNATNIISVIDTKIEVEVPVGPLMGKTEITVYVSNLTSNQKPFSYLIHPSITSITTTCFPGSTVVITGKNFSPDPEGNIVRFGNIEASVIEATATYLKVIAPNLGSATTADVTVTRLDMVSNALKINVDSDQNKIATYNWTTHTVKPGVIYKTGEFTLFGSTTRRIHVLDVTLDQSNTLGIGFSTSNKTTVAMCNDYDAVAGINAGYFPISGASNKDPYIRVDGIEVQSGHLGVNPIFTNSALLINNNVATIKKFTESGSNLNQVAAAIPISQAKNIIVCGPILIVDNQIESQNMDNSHNSSYTARTGLGVTADGKRVFMVVVDYNQGATGVQTPQLAKILQALGAVNAINFDGGGSSTMFVKEQGVNGRVSINTYSQRAVRSVIYVK